MNAPRPRMQDVVLIDDDVLAAVALDRPRTGDLRPVRRSAWRRRARRWWPAAAVLVLVLAAGTSLLADRREGARLAALGTVPGVLAPLDGPATELWRSTGGEFSDLATVAGRLVGVENRIDGSVDIVALDPVTGTTAWRVSARPPGELDTWASCAWPTAAGPAGVTSPTPVVVCVVVDRAAIHENAAGVWPYATGARLLAIDGATGAVLSDEPTEPSTSIATIGGDLVRSHVDSDGRVHVARTDAFGAVVRWSFTSPDPLPVNTAGRQQAWVSVVDGLVVVTSGSGWVLSGDGSVLRTWKSDPTTWDGGQVDVLARGRVLAETGTSEAGAAGSHVVDLTTGRSFADGGYAIRPMPDDGSLAGLVLLQSASGQNLVARDTATGRRSWTARGGTSDIVRSGLIVIDARVIRAEAGALRAVDGRTGRTIWATPITTPAPSSLFTDGRVVLRAQSAPNLGLVLAAYGLGDGRLVWQTDVPDDLTLFTVDGRLYGESDEGVIAYG